MNLLCPNCQKLLTVPEQYAGQLMKCPLCAGTFTVPGLPAAPAAAPPPAAPSPPAGGDVYSLQEPAPSAPTAAPPPSASTPSPSQPIDMTAPLPSAPASTTP